MALYQIERTISHARHRARVAASIPRPLTRLEQARRPEQMRKDPTLPPEAPFFVAIMEEYFAVLSIHKVIEWLEAAALPAPIAVVALPMLALKPDVKRVRHAREHEDSRILNQLAKDDSVVLNDIGLGLSGDQGEIQIDPTATLLIDDTQHLLGGTLDLLIVERYLTTLDRHLHLFVEWTEVGRRAVRDEVLRAASALHSEARTRGDVDATETLGKVAKTLQIAWYAASPRDVNRSLREWAGELERAGYDVERLGEAIARAELLS